MATWIIEATAADMTAIVPVRQSVQQVPLAWAPYIGSENDTPTAGAWDDGQRVRDPVTHAFVSPPILRWGVTDSEFLTGQVNGQGTTWSPSLCVSTLQGLSGVTCVAKA